MDFLNSAFFSAFFGALAGATSAAFLGWWLDRNGRLREEILACNVAIAQCAAISQSYIALKRQQILPLLRNYEIERVRYLTAFLTDFFGGTGTFSFIFDLKSTMTVWSPIDALNKIINERILSVSRPALIAASLTQAIHNHALITDRRNSVLERFRQIASFDTKHALYFGYATSHGMDSSYPDTLFALSAYTDDCVYFSMLLIEILHKRGCALATKLGRFSPHINEPNFDDPSLAGLLPDPENYKDFERQFGKQSSEIVVTM